MERQIGERQQERDHLPPNFLSIASQHRTSLGSTDPWYRGKAAPYWSCSRACAPIGTQRQGRSHTLVFNPREEGLTLLKRKAADKMPDCQLHIWNTWSFQAPQKSSLYRQIKHIWLHPPGGPMTYFNILTWQQLPPTLHEASVEIRVLLASSVTHTKALYAPAGCFSFYSTQNCWAGNNWSKLTWFHISTDEDQVLEAGHSCYYGYYGLLSLRPTSPSNLTLTKWCWMSHLLT